MLALLIVVLGGVYLLTNYEEHFAPQAEAVWVAIEVAGGGPAHGGTVEIETGQAFVLHAVVEARTRGGDKVYYTEATDLLVDGVPVPAQQLRPWDREQEARVLWFTVESTKPYIEADADLLLRGLAYREIFQGDWPQAWSVPGRIQPTVENFLPNLEASRPTARFGIQRYHVRVDFFGTESAIVPALRLRSSGSQQMSEEPEAVATIVSRPAGLLASVGGVFNLPQIEAATDGDRRLLDAVEGWTTKRIAFSRAAVLRRWLAAIGSEWDDLSWSTIELQGGEPWPGDGALLRAGARFAFLYQDRGTAGRIDYKDLCLDFDRGAAVRTLGDVYTGAGLVEWTAGGGE